jgi:hypothetical protein
VSGNRFLSRIFAPRNVEAADGWRKSDEFHNLYCSRNIIRMIKSLIVGWAGCVERMGEIKMHTKYLSENFKETSWGDDTKKIFKIGREVVSCIQLVEVR